MNNEMCSDVIREFKTQCGDLPYTPDSIIVQITKKFRRPRKAKKHKQTPKTVYYYTSMGKVSITFDGI